MSPPARKPGADEMVTGYYDHFNLHLYEIRDNPEWKGYLNDWKMHTSGFVRNPHLRNPELYFRDSGFRKHIYLNNDEFRGFIKHDFTEEFCEENYTDSLLRNRMLNELFHECIPVILHEDDLNSMMYSIENRSPYLDRDLFDFAYSIPPEHLIRGGYGKYVLREAVKGILNDQVRLDRCKKGFNASFNSIIDLDDDRNLEFLLDSDSGVFDLLRRDKIESLLKMEFLPNSISKFLFNFLNTKLFLEMN